MRYLLRLVPLGIALAVTAGTPRSAMGASKLEGTVVWVDDGDTIHVRIGERTEQVRYIGIDAPEIEHPGRPGMPGGQAATQLNRTLVMRRPVRIELDAEERDQYGRLLAYVWTGAEMVNAEMLRRGYARVLVIPPNIRYAAWFLALESEARENRRGLWGDGALADAALGLPAPAGGLTAHRHTGNSSRAIGGIAPTSVRSKGWTMIPRSRHLSRSSHAFLTAQPRFRCGSAADQRTRRPRADGASWRWAGTGGTKASTAPRTGRSGHAALGSGGTGPRLCPAWESPR